MIRIEGDFHKYFCSKKSRDSRKWAKCAERDEYGRQCLFQKRLDQLKDQIKKGIIHKCNFSEAKSSNTLELYAEDAKESFILEQDIRECIIKLIGRLNLSLNVGTSNEMHNLITTCIKYGIEIGKQNRKSCDIANYYHKTNRETLKQLLIDVANKEHKTIMSHFSLYPYCSIAIDEGTTKRLKQLVFNVENSSTKFKPYPCLSLCIEGLDTDNYINEIEHGFQNISNYKIRIGNVIVDGSKAQLKALHYIVHESKKFKWTRRLIITPCLCHRIQNALKMAIKNNKNLERIIKSIHDISAKCLEMTSLIGHVCPTHVSTRWIYDYNIAEFILKHQAKINELKIDIPSDLKELKDSLEITKALTIIFEDPHTSLGSAYIIIEHAIFALEELSETNKYAKTIMNYLKKYTIDSDCGGQLLTAYLLTPKGHSDFYKRLAEPSNIQRKGYINEFYVKRTPESDEIEEIIDILTEEGVNKILEAEGNEIIEEEEEGEPFPMGQVEERTYDIIDDVFHITYSIDFRKGLLQPAYQFITDWANQFLVDLTERKHFISVFHTFVSQPFPDLAVIDNGNRYDWLDLRTNPELSLLSDLALRLESSGCSEASCERTISAQRLILSSRRLRSSKKLLDSRLTLMRANIK